MKRTGLVLLLVALTLSAIYLLRVDNIHGGPGTATAIFGVG